MNMFAFVLSLILAIGLGFGLSCHIFASILAKSNDIGNSVGEPSQYKAEVKYDRTMHRMDEFQKKEFTQKYLNDEYFLEEKKHAKSEPDSETLILETDDRSKNV